MAINTETAVAIFSVGVIGELRVRTRPMRQRIWRRFIDRCIRGCYQAGRLARRTLRRY